MAGVLQTYLRSEYSYSVHGGVPSLLAVVSSPAHQHAPHECTAVPGPSLGTVPKTIGPSSTFHCRPPWQCSATELWLALTLYQAFLRRGLPGSYACGPRFTRPSFAEAYLGATPVVRDCLPRSAPFVASAFRLALLAPSILRCRGTACPVALGPSPLPKGTTSKGGGSCPRKPHARSHSGPMHIEKMSKSQLPSQRHMHSALNKHLRYYIRTTAGIRAAASCSGLGVMHRFSNENSSRSAMTSGLPHCRGHPPTWVGNPGQEFLGNTGSPTRTPLALL